jgi:tetratricopeptide (TPR) repeat protein/DNA-binding CsgD family transcriptional regulator
VAIPQIVTSLVFRFWLLLLLSLLLPASFLVAGNLDSLQRAYADAEGEEKLKLLEAIFVEDYRVLTVEDLKKGASEADSLGFHEMHGNLLCDVGFYLNYLGKFSEAVPYLLDGLRILKEHSSPKNCFYSAIGLFDAVTYAQEYDIAIQTGLYLDSLAKIIDTPYARFQASYAFGCLYGELENWKEAKFYMSEALKAADTLSHDYGVAQYTLGSIYIQEGKLDSALLLTERAVYFYQRWELGEDFPHHLPMAMYNLAEVHYHLGNYEKTISLAEEALPLVWSGDPYSLGSLIGIAAKAEISLGLLEHAKESLRSLDPLMQEVSDLASWSLYHELRRDVARAEGKHKLAWKYDSLHTIFEDSLYYNEREITQLGVMAQYEVRKREEQISLLQKVNRRQREVMILGIVAAFLLISGGLLYYRQYRIKSIHKIALLEQKKASKLEMAALQARQNKEKLEYMARTLSSNTTYLRQKNQMLAGIRDEVTAIAKELSSERQELDAIVRRIDQSMEMDADWQDFKKHFEMVHPDFFTKLSQQYKVSNNDLRLLAYLKMNLANKEVARLMNITPQSVLTAKYRLKKKLGLSKKEDLREFIDSL